MFISLICRLLQPTITAAAAAVRSRRSTAVVQISRQRVREEAEHHERQVLIAGANAKVKARLEQFRIHELTGSRREALALAAEELDQS